MFSHEMWEVKDVAKIQGVSLCFNFFNLSFFLFYQQTLPSMIVLIFFIIKRHNKRNNKQIALY